MRCSVGYAIGYTGQKVGNCSARHTGIAISYGYRVQRHIAGVCDGKMIGYDVAY